MLRPAIYDEFSEKARERYYQIKSELQKKYSPGDVVLIEPDSGDYFVGQTTIEAYKKAEKKYPRKTFFGAQVGRLAFQLKKLWEFSSILVAPPM